MCDMMEAVYGGATLNVSNFEKTRKVSFRLGLFLFPFFCESSKGPCYGGRESSTRCNFRKQMQIEKAPANQENIFINLTAGAANAHNTNK